MSVQLIGNVMFLTQLPSSIYLEFTAGFLLWWFAVYLITRNPLDRVTQLLFLIFFSLSYYLTSDVFFSLAVLLKEFSIIGFLLRISTWSIYLPYAVLFHLSYLLQKKKSKTGKIILFFSYLLTASVIYFEAGTNLIRNYPYIASSQFEGYIPDANGSNFWIMGVYILVLIAATLACFLKLLLAEKKYSMNWWKYFYPSLALILNLIFGPMIVLSYYGIGLHSQLLESLTVFLTGLFFAFAIAKYRLFIEEPKIIFGKNLFYSTIVILIVAVIIAAILSIYPINIVHVSNLLSPVLIIFFISACLPIYNWLSTFINDLQFNMTLGLSVVNDIEVYNALKNYSDPRKLEDSPLLRLSVVKNGMKNKKSNPVDSLRLKIEEAVKYFENKDDLRRTKQNLKYHFLKMFVFDQAEEGQILWELGFEDYPLSIMSREGKSRSPKFKEFSPAEYSYISRNAFIALKKEAIHDVTWRISYLEKLSRRKMF